MREQMNDLELDNVVGGTVMIDGNKMIVGFTSTRKKYNLKNCTAKQASALVVSLYDENLSDSEYDAKCKAALVAKGWI